MINFKSFCFVFTFLLLVILGSCTKNDELYNNGPIIEGKQANISLALNVKKSNVESRANTEDEDILHNIYIYIFNEEGNLDTKHYIVNPQYTDDIKNMTTLSGNNKQIHAVANIGLGIMSITREELDEVTSLEDLENIYPSLLQQTLQRGAEFLMSGYLSDENGNIVSFDIRQGNDNIAPGNIILNRLDAKVTFNITSERGVTFRARSWQVLRVSSNTSIVRHSDSVQYPIERTYFDSSVEDLASSDGLTTFSFYTLENSLKRLKDIPETGLATPEDKYYDKNGTVVETANADEEVKQHARYALRDKRVKEAEHDENTANTVTNGAFEYANANSTYVKIIGTISYPDPNNIGHIIQGTVEYTIHLGYAKQNQNDYETNVNTIYTYNINIVSVNSIIVEATSDKEDSIERQPSIEGVVESVKTSINVDSHYEVSKFTVNKDVFTTMAVSNDYLEEDEKFFWYISTPFEYQLTSSLDENIKDYKWVYFRLNEKDAEGNYNNFYETYKNDIYKENDSYATNLEIADYLENGTNKLITIAQLSKILNSEYAKYQSDASYSSPLLDKNDQLIFTVFINEFFYQNDPTTSNETTPVDKLLWKKFVNKEPRTMGILKNIYVSADNNSIYTRTELAISQAAIQTIYNVNAESLLTAWGTENYPTLYRDLGSTDPVRRIPFAEKKEIENSNLANNFHHGLANTLHLVGGENTNWVDVIDPTVNQLSQDYQLVRYACMQRNRDLNANGKLDKNELRWYLASIHQLSDIWIGEKSLKGLRLYNGRGIMPEGSEEPNDIVASTQWGEELYVSSTILGENVYHLWASEGSSTSLDSYVNGRNDALVSDRSYRCLRDLGFDDDKRENFKEVPQDFAYYDKDTRTIDLKFLNPSSLRVYSSLVELPTHDEQSLDNLPRASFEFAADVKRLPGNISEIDWNTMQTNITQGISFCPEGYRMPNQRELALMASRIVDEEGRPDESQWFAPGYVGRMFSRTSFSLDPLSGDIKRPAFAAIMNKGVLNLILMEHGRENEPNSHVSCQGRVRCVKDLE